jgi:hypothetical protein
MQETNRAHRQIEAEDALLRLLHRAGEDAQDIIHRARLACSPRCGDPWLIAATVALAAFMEILVPINTAVFLTLPLKLNDERLGLHRHISGDRRSY